MTELQYLRSFSTAISKVGVEVTSLLVEHLKVQGHVHKGKLVKSLRSVIQTISTAVVLSYYGNDYALGLEDGIAKSNFPGVRSAEYKALVRKLTQYFREKRVLNPALVAGRTVRIWKREGMPTSGSYHYSHNGKRTGFISDTLADDELFFIAEREFYNVAEIGISQAIETSIRIGNG